MASTAFAQWGPRPRRIRPIVNTNLHIKPGNYVVWNVRIENRNGAWLGGGFTASSDVEFFVLTQEEFERWRNNESYSYIFATGRISRFIFDPPLGLGPGDYRLVLSNKFSIFTSKDVRIILQTEEPYN